MARIEGVDPARIEKRIRAVLEVRAKRWGGLDASGLLDPALVALIDRRVAYLNGCEF